MDIEYLLLLQNFRNSTHDFFTPFMEQISLISINFVLFAIAVSIYWAFSKKIGVFLLANSSLGNVINSALKCTFCVYRPWIKDVRVLPAGDAIHTATGYSFPSGHTQAATAYYGGGAYLLYQNKRFWWCTLLCFMILLTGFSRNYLGVHTPQDVVVAIICTSFVLIFNWFMLTWADKSQNNDLKILLGSLLIIVGFLCYISLKPYPTDYVDGHLLVDPTRMQDDSWGAAGMFAGVALGWFTERRFAKFVIDGTIWQKLIRIVLGLIPLYVLHTNMYAWTVNAFDIHSARLLGTLVPFFFAVGFYPICISIVQRLITNQQKRK